MRSPTSDTRGYSRAMTESHFITAALLTAVISLSCIFTSFALIVLRGWRRAMASTPRGGWSLPRVLMLAGASLGVLFSAMMTVFAS